VAFQAISACSWPGESDLYCVPSEMDVSVVQPTVTKAPVPAGLSSAEASRRLLEYGPNAVVEPRVNPVAQAVRHFWAPVPWMLEATIALQIAIGERLEALMIATLLILNVALGVFQENRAGAALALLKQHLALKARVRRDGEWVEALAADLVPRDIVQLSLGSVVPADLRIIAGTLLLDQSMLTGESIPAETGFGKIAYAGCAGARRPPKSSLPEPAPISAAPPNSCGSPMSRAASSGRCSVSCAI
jgi:E1-E2 ATPase/Cation transporter/ATPase, N-terminus